MLGTKMFGCVVAVVLLITSFMAPAAHAASIQSDANAAAVAAIQTGTNATTTAAVNLRSGAGTSYAVQRVVPAGATVYVTAGPFNTSWYQVTYDNTSGYVHSTYLQQNGTSTPPPSDGGSGTATTTAAVNLRSGAGTGYSILLTIPAGKTVEIVAGPVNSVWFKVNYDGKTGYVHGSYLNRSGTGTGGAKRIVVDLSDQWVYAYEGNVQVFAAPASTGKDGFRTPVGSYTVLSKYRSKTMRGSANGETWYAENVPFVLFFTNRGHALHGAPWLASSVFGSGQRRSHGCVNLPVSKAEQLYNWAPLGTPVQVRQ